MSWRGVITYNKYLQIAGRATRAALKEEERVQADKRNAISLRWQEWKDGKGGAQTWVVPPADGH
ncbi:hypothetical protein T439DRAFT_326332 [Meredithblackwellia eburnea MCA 4105]